VKDKVYLLVKWVEGNACEIFGVYSSLENALKNIARMPPQIHSELCIMEYEIDSYNGYTVWCGWRKEDREKLEIGGGGKNEEDEEKEGRD